MIASDQTYEDLQGSELASKNSPPWPLCQFPLQVFAQFEFLPWFLSVDCDLEYVSQINLFLPKLLFVKLFYHSSSNLNSDNSP